MTNLIFALGLFAVALAMIGGFIIRHTRAGGFATLCAAVVTAVVAGILALPIFEQHDQIARLKIQLGEKDEALVVARATTDEARGKAAAAETQRVALAKQQADYLAGLWRQVDGIKIEYQQPNRDVVLEAPPRQVEPRTREDQLVNAIDDLRHIKARPVASPITTASTPSVAVKAAPVRPEIDALQQRLAQPVRTANYDIEPYPAPDLIGGRTGKYYAIDLKDADKGVRFYFEGGKYTLRTGTREFRTSLNHFISDVLGKMEGQVKYDIFVRGSADNKPFTGRIDRDHQIRDVTYLRQVGEDRYSGETRTMTLSGDLVRNQDLPNLRAAFIRDLVAATYPVKAPQILEGSVTPKRDDRDRNVELILFVQW